MQRTLTHEERLQAMIEDSARRYLAICRELAARPKRPMECDPAPGPEWMQREWGTR